MIINKNKAIIMLCILIFVFTFLLITLSVRINNNKQKNPDENFYKEIIEYIYNDDATFFKFIDNKAIYPISELKKGYKNIDYSILTVNGDFEECTGYIIITKLNNQTLDIDTSKICDNSNNY